MYSLGAGHSRARAQARATDPRYDKTIWWRQVHLPVDPGIDRSVIEDIAATHLSSKLTRNRQKRDHRLKLWDVDAGGHLIPIDNFSVTEEEYVDSMAKILTEINDHIVDHNGTRQQFTGTYVFMYSGLTNLAGTLTVADNKVQLVSTGDGGFGNSYSAKYK